MFLYPTVNYLEFCSIMDRFVPGNLIVSARDPHIRANHIRASQDIESPSIWSDISEELPDTLWQFFM